jgi:hypothetical protein
MDLLDVAERRIREAGYGTTYFRRLDAATKKEGIVMRPLPCTTKGKYYTGERDVLFYFQVMSKRRSEEQAMGEAMRIADLLEKSDMRSMDGSYRITSLDIDTEPGEIEASESLYYIWGFTALASITTNERI